jgi:very-short-patch-repair endonuclease
MTTEAPSLLRKLLDYVVEQSKVVDPQGFKLSAQTGFIRRPLDLAGLPGLDLDVKVEGDHIWMRVKRLEAHLPPALPQGLDGLVRVPVDPHAQVPVLDDQALARHVTAANPGKPPEEVQQALAATRQQAAALMAQYVASWKAWAGLEAPRRKTIALYGDLFALKHQLASEETAKPQELVWGMGIAAWRLTAPGEGGGRFDFQYPLLTQAMEIAIEPETLAISVRPRDVSPRAEFDAFAACQLADVANVEQAARQKLAADEEHPLTPFDISTFEPVLKLVAGTLDKNGRYVDKQTAPPAAGDDLVVTDAWTLFSRPRPNNFLHDDIQRLKQRIDSDPLPPGAVSFVTPPSDERLDHESVRFRGLSSGPLGHGTGPVCELFFPLPYNQEQVTIIGQLERAHGVAVQGPPGTGKTHTIANIVCHYLATGRKVLVTSKGEQALEVLQDKIPESVRPLTVALLSGDREGLRQFQNSIEAIIHNVSQLNTEVVQSEIGRLRSNIDQAHEELAALDKRVDEIALAQLSNIEVDGVKMRAAKMAEFVIAGNEPHSWFDDVLTLDEKHAPAMTDAEVAAVREARRRVGKDVVYATCAIPASHSLPAAADIGALHETLVSIKRIEQAESKGQLLPLRGTRPDVIDAARTLLAQVGSAQQLAHQLEESGQMWTADLRRKCRVPENASERAAFEALLPEIKHLVDARAELLKRPVELPEGAAGNPKFLEAVERGAETGKPFGFISIGASHAKQLVGAVRVAGLAPATPEDWRQVQAFVELQVKVHTFAVRWNAVADTLSLPQVNGNVRTLRETELVCGLAQKAHLLGGQFDVQLPQFAQKVFEHPPLKELRGTSADLAKVADQLRKHLARADMAKATVLRVTLNERLAGKTGPVSEELRGFAATMLGNPNFSPEQVVVQYADLVAKLQRIEGLAEDFKAINALADSLHRAGAARFAQRVRTQPTLASGEDTVLPMNWRPAWTWARLKSHLESIESRQELLQLAARRRDLERGLARLYEDICSKSAWLSTKQNASGKVLSALETYKTSIRRIGQGTGPNASRYRRDAQRAMHDAQDAVPCWVMSHSKVSETLPAKLGSFDLVVVDEASQSDLWALPAVLRGKRVLVVGDDKQVSPDGGFISAARIQDLVNRFLVDQPHKATLTPEKSLYDMASSIFAANKVMLREHFRCVPAIIAYSNRFYNDFMQPLRIPKESERIDPPLVDIFVPTGNRDKSGINKPEAHAIAAEVQAILANEQFAGRSIGVVSLLGPEQAQFIDTLVRSKCDAAELIRRNFKCGDARVFQGSERHIMFLSMVADPQNHHALSGNMFEQRFNVAASRAQDRMYLVRSVQLHHLSPTDLRGGLLGHFTKPLESSVDRSKSLIELCQSGFERDVYMQLFNRGYRVIPQVKAGAFFIDMVVEGARDARLAIELDGDDYHGPDRWPHDMVRQRVLERAGWTFWRCFASTWSLRRDEVLQELLARLNAMGIEPLGTLEKIPSLVESRVWQSEPSEIKVKEATLPAAVQPGPGSGRLQPGMPLH